MIIREIKFRTADNKLWDTYELASEHEKTLSRLHSKMQMKLMVNCQTILKKDRRRLSQTIAFINRHCQHEDWKTKNALENDLRKVLQRIIQNTCYIRQFHREFGHKHSIRK